MKKIIIPLFLLIVLSVFGFYFFFLQNGGTPSQQLSSTQGSNPPANPLNLPKETSLPTQPQVEQNNPPQKITPAPTTSPETDLLSQAYPLIKKTGVIENQKESDSNQTAVVDALSLQFSNKRIKFYGTAVSYPYAMQGWADENTGGDALLKHDDQGKWVLIDAGGGGADYSILLENGVPSSIALDLLTKLR